jgi:hypothetical protein
MIPGRFLTRDAGRAEGSMDAANIMKPALARGNLRRGTRREDRGRRNEE